MSRQNNYARNQFFRQSMARADVLRKRKESLKAAKAGEVLPDPTEVVEKVSDEVVPDPEVVEEA